MEKIFLLNAFSLNMINTSSEVLINVKEISLEEAKSFLQTNPWESAVGHAPTAMIFSEQLGTEVPCLRSTVSLPAGAKALVGQYSGPRLEEGAVTLPDGAVIKWLVVTVG